MRTSERDNQTLLLQDHRQLCDVNCHVECQQGGSRLVCTACCQAASDNADASVDMPMLVMQAAIHVVPASD